MGEVKLLATPQSSSCARIEWALKMKGVEYEYMKENLLNKGVHAGVAQGEGKGEAIESALESLALLDEQIEGKTYFGGEEIGYLDIVAGGIPYWLNVLEQVGDMELLTPQRFPHLHQWSLNLMQTSPVKDCLPPRDSVVDYFSFGLNHVRSMSSANNNKS
ncbi:hypothetical protein K1719_023815 [Acacia pycnantha]|nr:hypothetical protein K1719_023815 [Acacia pycnantha]